MPAPIPLSRRFGAAVAFAAGLAISQGVAAQDHGAHGAATAAPAIAASAPPGLAPWPDSPSRGKKTRLGVAAEAASASAPPASAPVATTAPAPRGPRDPMDMLRERLAEKLGAVKPPGSDNPNVVRVVSKPSARSAGDAADLQLSTPKTGAASRRARPVDAALTGALPVAAATAPHGDPRHWSYDGSGGPQAWAELSPEFAKCGNGTRQSPIDIRDGIKVELDAVRFDYKPGGFRVLDNGHTVQVNVSPGNSIEVLGRRYELMQFHFHRPSEERIDGKQFDMVVHLLHKDLDGHLAMVAVLLERGAAQPLIQSVWNNLPLEKGEDVAARVALNPSDLLPASHHYYTYMGSMTTPPCSEGVLWMVMKEPVQVSTDQIGIFARLYPMNARPVQSAWGRLIKESN